VILNNLISNAIKYKDVSKEESFVTIFVDAIVKSNYHYEDNGIGIAEDKQGRVFEMFYRATKLTTGSGLGMYCKRNIRKANNYFENRREYRNKVYNTVSKSK
jgi:signal transduction histidine kinase